MTDTPAPAPVVCQVSLRARVTVGEPFFEHGRALTLGRVGSVDARPGDLVAVRITGPGQGVVVAHLGAADDVSAVLHGLAVEAGAAAPWPAEVAAEVARLPEEPPAGLAGRTDLRSVLTFTIDPADARDHDDALSVDGDRVLVHIADVAAFVPEEGAIEAQAARRATSVYLPGRVDPMLPEGLSCGLCSLIPGRDRWAVTVEVGGEGPLRAFRSVIHSDHRLTYDEAEAMLGGGDGPPDLVAALRRLDQVAAGWAAARLARGGIAVETAERTFRIAAGEVMDGHLRRSGAAHRLVEEL
ncbi:MAG: RNB domain-containing ribonuclease, partial [Gaiellales bacterium]